MTKNTFHKVVANATIRGAIRSLRKLASDCNIFPCRCNFDLVNFKHNDAFITLVYRIQFKVCFLLLVHLINDDHDGDELKKKKRMRTQNENS